MNSPTVYHDFSFNPNGEIRREMKRLISQESTNKQALLDFINHNIRLPQVAGLLLRQIIAGQRA